MANIFISYNRESQSAVENLAADLREYWGHEVWFDQALTGGQRWWDNILEQIRVADVFAFVVSAESLESQACMRELDYAAVLGRPILPVLLSGELDATLLRQPLNEIHCVDYRVDDRVSRGGLRRAIDGLHGAPPLPQPLPEPPAVPLSYLGNLRERIDSAATLSYEEQAGLVLDLKNYQKGRDAGAEVSTLLMRLRQRQDLLAVVSDEITEVMASITSGSEAAELAQADPVEPVPAPKADVDHRIDRVVTRPRQAAGELRTTPTVGLENDPPQVFASGELKGALKVAAERAVLHAENWKLILDDPDEILLFGEKEPGEDAALRVVATLRDTVSGKKAGALEKLGWTLGEGESMVKGAGAGAVIYATGGVGALGLLSKTVRDFLLTGTATSRWTVGDDPSRLEKAVLEIAAAVGKIADADAIFRLEKIVDG